MIALTDHVMATSVSGQAIKRAEKELAQTKVILRHLPPDLTKDALHEVLDPLPPYNYFSFVSGNPALGKSGYSRAYINFDNCEDIVNFRDRHDGCLLESAKKDKYRIIVEYAPFQACPHTRPKPDPRCGQIEQDSDYQAFLEQYESVVDPLPSVDLSYLDTLERVPEVQMTPLIEFLKERRTPKPGRGGRNKVLYIADSKKKKKKDKVKGEVKIKGETKDASLKTKPDRGASKDDDTKVKKIIDKNSKSKPVVIIHHNDKHIPNGDSKTKSSEKVPDGSSKTRETRKVESTSKHRERPDIVLYSVRNDKRKSSPVSSRKDDSSSYAKDPPRSSRSKYTKSSSYHNDRHENYYQFQEDEDGYQGPDAAKGRGHQEGSGRRGSGRGKWDGYHGRDYEADDRGSSRYYGNRKDEQGYQSRRGEKSSRSSYK